MSSNNERSQVYTRPNRTGMNRCKYFFMRTWFYETCCTVFPMTLMVFIVLGMFAFQEQTITTSRELLVEHSMPPVLFSMRSMLNEQVRLLEYVKAVVSSGTWAEPEDDLGLAAHIVPYFVKDADFAAGVNPPSKSIDIGLVVRSLSDPQVQAGSPSQMVSFYTPRLADFTLFANKLNRTPNRWERIHRRRPSALVFEQNQDRSQRFDIPSRTVYVLPEEMTATFTPWSNDTEELDTQRIRRGQSSIWGFANVTTNATVANQFGIEFTAQWVDRVRAGALMQQNTSFFATVHPSSWDRYLPGCQGLHDGLRVVVFNESEVDAHIVAYNCVPGGAAMSRRLSEYGAELGMIQDGSSTSTAQKQPNGININGQIIQRTVIPELGEHYVVVSVILNTSTWNGHQVVVDAIRTFGRRQLNFVASIRQAARYQLDDWTYYPRLERVFLPLLAANPCIGVLVHKGDGRTMFQSFYLDGELGTMNTMVFLPPVIPSNLFYDVTLRNFVTAQTTNAFKTMCALQGNNPENLMCSPVLNLANGSTKFFTGFDYNRHVASAVQVPWFSTAQHLAESGRFDLTFMDADTLHAEMVQSTRFHSFPVGGVYTQWPEFVHLRYRFPLVQLREEMKIALGGYTDGQMMIINDFFERIALEGSTNTFSEILQSADEITGFPEFSKATFYFMRSQFLKGNCEEEGAQCDRSGEMLAVARTVSEISGKTIFLMRLQEFSIPGRVVNATWWLVATFPTRLVTTVTTTNKIIAIAAIVFAIIFLIISCTYSLYTVASILELKRVMRRIGRGDATYLTNRLDPTPNLSTCNEIRDIQEAILKIRDASIEYRKYLPSGIEQAMPMPDSDDDPDDKGPMIRTGRPGFQGQAYLDEQEKENTEDGGLDSSSSGRERLRRHPRLGIQQQDDKEMTAVAVPQSDSLAGAGTGNTSSPLLGASPTRAFQDLLLSHEAGTQLRDVCLLQVHIVNANPSAAPPDPSVISVLTTLLGNDLFKHVKLSGGQPLPWRGSSFRAVWLLGRVKPQVQAAAVLSTVAMAEEMLQQFRLWYTQKRFTFAFRVVITLNTGKAYIGAIGTEKCKTHVFCGPVFENAVELHDIVLKQLLNVPVAPTPQVDCLVLAACDRYTQAVTREHATFLPLGKWEQIQKGNSVLGGVISQSGFPSNSSEVAAAPSAGGGNEQRGDDENLAASPSSEHVYAPQAWCMVARKSSSKREKIPTNAIDQLVLKLVEHWGPSGEARQLAAKINPEEVPLIYGGRHPSFL